MEVTWILLRYSFSLLSCPPVPTSNFVVEMGGRRLHPSLCIQSMPKIAGFLLKGLCILETSEKKLRGSFPIVHENTFFAIRLRKCCPELSSGHLNNCSSLVKSKLRQRDLYPFLGTSILRLNQSLAMAHLAFSVLSGVMFRGKKKALEQSKWLQFFLMEISEGMRSSWNSSYSWG